jgi:hypothetical protein
LKHSVNMMLAPAQHFLAEPCFECRRAKKVLSEEPGLSWSGISNLKKALDTHTAGCGETKILCRDGLQSLRAAFG